MEEVMLFCMLYGGFRIGIHLSNAFIFSVFGRRLRINTILKDGSKEIVTVRYRPFSYQHRLLWRMKLYRLGFTKTL